MVERGKFFLYDSVVPALEAGAYTLHGDISLDGAADLPVEGLQTHVNVTAPRYRLPPDQALSVFPPANAEGAWESRLPQIVLKKRTLPWDRRPAPAGTVINTQKVNDTTPWLALVIIAEGEGEIVHDAAIADCVTAGVTLAGAADVARGSYLNVPASVVRAVFPTIEDLAMLTHVREVSLEDTEAAMGDDDGFLAVVIANRMPQFDTQNCRAKAYTACLINLEGQLDALPPPAPPRMFFDFSDLFLNADIRMLAEATISGAAVPVVATAQPRRLNLSDGNALTDAIRRGEVVFHAGRLTDRAGVIDGGTHVLGTIDATSVLGGDFSALSSVTAATETATIWKAKGTFAGFDFPLDLVIRERKFRFPLLTSWRFTASGSGSFEGLMRDLDVGLLGTTAGGGYRRPLPACAPVAQSADPDNPPPARLPLETAETGHVGLPHLTRMGSRQTAWYRGPFSPHRLLRRAATETDEPLLAHVSDHLRMMTPDGRQDVSLAVAFETGRLLAMSQPSFVAAVMRWRGQAFGASLARAKQRHSLIDPARLLNRFLSPRDLDRLLAGIDRQMLVEAVSGSLFTKLHEFRSGAVCPPRPLVQDALVIDALQGDLSEIMSNGLGLDRAMLSRLALAPDSPVALADLMQAVPGVVAATPVELDGRTTGIIDTTLQSGLDRLAELAVGPDAISTGNLKDVKVFDDMLDFLDSRFGKGR